MNIPLLPIVLFGLGCLVGVVGGIMVLVAAFRQSLVWGLVSIFVPFGNLVFTCLHWAEAKKGTLVGLAGLALCGGAFFTVPTELRVGFGKGGPLALAADSQPPAKDLTAQIADQRAKLETQNAVFAQDGVELSRQFAELETRRKSLPAGDAGALAKFNADAAIYQARTTRRKQLFADIEAGQRELDAMLAKRSLAAAGGTDGRQVVMYSTARCPACQMAKQYFAQKGVRYQEIDVENSAAGRAAYERLGGRGVPLIMVGEKRVDGFSAQALDALL